MTQRNSDAARRVLIVPHGGRADVPQLIEGAVAQLTASGIEVRMLASDVASFARDAVITVDEAGAADDCELVLVFGGDGTILRAAYLARDAGAPLLGVNLGHMGFLAESEPDALPAVIQAVVNRAYEVEERTALNLTVIEPRGRRSSGWALNDVSIEKAAREQMVEYVLAIDDVPLSTLAADGLVCATPTGSTAYAWSAGGPVVWPEVDALIVVPISAHALFSRPLVIDPASEIDVEVLESSPPAIAWCDGSRLIDVPSGSRIEIRRSATTVKLARLHEAPFTERLVRKFDLPVRDWRGRGADNSSGGRSK